MKGKKNWFLYKIKVWINDALPEFESMLLLFFNERIERLEFIKISSRDGI